jgi:DNA/RNA-binding domain of Phe-tRNA-synthetase-like protein
MLVITDECRNAYPGISAGLLIMKNVWNLQSHEELESRKQELQSSLRSEFSEYTRKDFKDIETIKIYVDYYKKFKKSYHVLLQLESVVLKNKSIPDVSALVETMFMAELKNLLLTASHDVKYVEFPLSIDVSKGSEEFLTISNKTQQLYANDLFCAGQKEIISDIVYGPDFNTRIRPDTEEVMHVVYGLPGIDEKEVMNHLMDIKEYTEIFSPEAEVQVMKVYK